MNPETRAVRKQVLTALAQGPATAEELEAATGLAARRVSRGVNSLIRSDLVVAHKPDAATVSTYFLWEHMMARVRALPPRERRTRLHEVQANERAMKVA